MIFRDFSCFALRVLHAAHRLFDPIGAEEWKVLYAGYAVPKPCFECMVLKMAC